MKQLLFIILLAAFSIRVSLAETNSGTKETISPDSIDSKYMYPDAPTCIDISKTTVIDSGFIRVLYALNATDIGKPGTYDDLQRLEIGVQCSKYYSYYVFFGDSSITFFMSTKDRALINSGVYSIPTLEGKFQGWSEYLFSEYFKNFSTNELTEYARMPRFLWKYDSQYTEPMPVQNWEISDDTLTVAGYLCQKATCRFRGRDYTAWFSNDIPISNGPWKFGGLPGLILKVYDKDKLYTFECFWIENHKQKYPITLLNSENRYNKTDRMKLWKLKKTIQENYSTMRQMKPENGHPLPKLFPYNPLELE